MLLCLFKKRKKENSEDQQEVKCLGTSSVLTIQTQTPCGTSHPQFCPSYHVPCISSTSIFLCFFFFFFQYLVLVLNQSVTAQNEALIQGMEGLNKYELRNNFPSKLHYNRTWRNYKICYLKGFLHILTERMVKSKSFGCCFSEVCGEIIVCLGGNLTILFIRKHIALDGQRWPFYVSFLYISPGWLGLVRKAQTLGFMASLPLDVCVALSNCSDFSETQHRHIQRGLLASSPDGWYEDSGIFKSQAGTQALWLLCFCSQNTVNSIGAVFYILWLHISPLISHNTLQGKESVLSAHLCIIHLTEAQWRRSIH